MSDQTSAGEGFSVEEIPSQGGGVTSPAVDLSPETARVEAERLRTGLRCLIRDWSEGWEDCTPFDQRDAYRALTDLLGPDYDAKQTWIATDLSTPPGQERG